MGIQSIAIHEIHGISFVNISISSHELTPDQIKHLEVEFGFEHHDNVVEGSVEINIEKMRLTGNAETDPGSGYWRIEFIDVSLEYDEFDLI